MLNLNVLKWILITMELTSRLSSMSLTGNHVPGTAKAFKAVLNGVGFLQSFNVVSQPERDVF